MSLEVATVNILEEQGLSGYEKILFMLSKDKIVTRLSDMLYDTNKQFKQYRDSKSNDMKLEMSHDLVSQNNMEYLELKGMISKQIGLLQMLIPKHATVSFLVESTGKSRQSIRQFLINNFEPEEDFWTKGGKMYVSQDTAVTILMGSIK